MDMAGETVLFYGYLFSWLWMSIEILRRSPSKQEIRKRIGIRTGLLWGGIAGIFSFIGMQLYTLALIEGLASIVAPLFATNSLVVALLSIRCFGERLSFLQKISLLLLFVGLALTRV